MMKDDDGAAELLELLDERCRHQDEAFDYAERASGKLVNKEITTDDKVSG
jgi:hypothetical protein